MAAEVLALWERGDLPAVGSVVVEADRSTSPHYLVVAHSCGHPEGNRCTSGAYATAIELRGWRYCVDGRYLEVVA